MPNAEQLTGDASVLRLAQCGGRYDCFVNILARLRSRLFLYHEFQRLNPKGLIRK